MSKYTAIIQQDGDAWIGWIEEVHGVNAQGDTREELLENLQITLDDMLDFYREKSRQSAKGVYEEVSL
jgi:predicted RNase H-like HicB family nuclease